MAGSRHGQTVGSCFEDILCSGSAPIRSTIRRSIRYTWRRIHEGIKFYPFYHAHNIFLNTLAEGGIFVGILLLVLVAAAFYGCYAILKQDPEDPFGLIALR